MKSNSLKILVVLSVIAGAFVLTSCNDKKTTNPGENDMQVVPMAAGEIRIATVNMDTLNDGLQMVVDIQDELDRTQKRLMDDLQRQAANFQKEYDNYLKIGATLTLSEQRKRESDLQQKQQNLGTLEQTYSNQIAMLQVQRMQEMQQLILDYIKRYEAENGPFTMVMMTGSNSGVLFSQPSLDITAAVLDGLNKEYAADKQTGKKSK